MPGLHVSLRGVVFTLIVPCVVGGWLPWSITAGSPLAGGIWRLGWLLVLVGAFVYLACLWSFLEAGGTPAVFFTRFLRRVWGEEPQRIVRSRLYRYSRNPMYLGIVTAAAGIAVVHASRPAAQYAIGLFLVFHLVVFFLEEPHLKARDARAFADYAARVPRWIGHPKRP
jgi:protein-S-isoprenylcysteine O-methyltransferase Ste14